MATPNLALIPSAYKARVVYSVLPNTGAGDFTFVRSGNATRINKDGLIETVDSHVPRLNYDLYQGKPKQCPSLLLEPSRTNLFTYSEDFSQSSWNKASSTVTLTSELSPNGTTNSVYNLTGTSANLYVGGTTGVQHTISFYIKSNGQGKDKFKLRLGNNTSIEYTATNEWVRYEYTETPTTSVFGITTTSAPNNEFDLLIWGGQSEQGSYATSYIPTNGSTETRNAEQCNSAGNSGTFNDSEGVLMVEIYIDEDIDDNVNISVSKGVHAEDLIKFIYLPSTNEFGFEVFGGTVRTTANYNNLLLGMYNKVSGYYDSSNTKLYINGFEVSTTSTNQLPTGMDQLNFDRADGSAPFYGNTKQIQYFDSALTDSQLEYLTSYRSFGDMVESQNYIIQ